MALLSDGAPCLRGVRLATRGWGRCHRRLPPSCQLGMRPASSRAAAASPSSSTRAEALSGSLPLGGFATSSGGSNTGGSAATLAEPSAVVAPQQQEQQQEQQAGGFSPGSSLLDLDPYKSKGGKAVGRAKPLKINLDLALYRARQTRIAATRSQDLAERSRLLRDAEAALRRLLELDPTDGRPYVSIGKILVTQRRYEEAARLYEEGAAATGGTNAYIWTAWAYLAVKQGNTFLARKLYDAALVADCEHAAAWHGWGLMEKDLGNYAKARDLWIKGIQATRRRPNPYLYQSLAVLAAELGVVDEARKWFRLGTDTVTGSASHALWQAWALLEARQGDPHAVRTLFRRGLAVSPRSRYTFLAWAVWEKQQGDVQEARRLFREGAKLNPRDAAILQAWAMMEEERGDLDAARRLFEAGSRADPSHLYVWQAWGVMEARAGNADAARELFQQGVWSAPPRDRDVSLLFQAWAVLEAGAGNTSMARQLFKCAVKADPRSEPSWLAWAEMEDSLGAIDRANELRSFSLQERQEVVRPANFTTMPASALGGGGQSNPLAQLSNLIAKWFNRGDDAEVVEMAEDWDPLAGLRSVDTTSDAELASTMAAAAAVGPANAAGAAAKASPKAASKAAKGATKAGKGARKHAAPAKATAGVGEGPSFEAAVFGATPEGSEPPSQS